METPDDPMVYLHDMTPDASSDETRVVMNRRVFAMPYGGTTIRGEHFMSLDPADEDERALLIKGEHPEYHEVRGSDVGR
jgi:hypothetical protein